MGFQKLKSHRTKLHIMKKIIRAVIVVVIFSQLSPSKLGASARLATTIVDTLPELSTNCPFVENSNDDGYISNEEYEIMQFCLDNRIENVEEFSNSILGVWELIGHGEGWVPNVSQPCVKIEITEFELVIDYQDQDLDTVTTHTWAIVDNNNYPFLEITPQIYYGLGFQFFCSEYMFADATPADGNMYLYQKQDNINAVNDLSTNQINVYPNPSTGLFDLEVSNSNQELNSIQVYDLHGRSVSFKYNFRGNSINLLDLTGNSQGTYFLVMDFEGKVYRKKIVIL